MANIVLLFRNLSLATVGKPLAANLFHSQRPFLSIVPKVNASSLIGRSTPEPPKRPMNSYSMFFTDVNERIRLANPGLKIPEIAKLIAVEWKGLDEGTRKRYLERSKELMEKYKEERKKFLSGLSEEQKEDLMEKSRLRRKQLIRRQLKMELRKLSYPKRPGSAFNVFMAEKLTKKGNTDFKEIGLMWKQLEESERTIYKEVAKQNKLEYLKAMEEWKSQHSTAEASQSINKLATLRTKIFSLRKKNKPTQKKAAKRSRKKVMAKSKLGMKLKKSERGKKQSKKVKIEK